MEIVESTKTGATISTKWGSVVMGCVVFAVLILLYFIYRYMKSVNKRFQSLEEIMGKVIEKNNQMQHLIQTTMRYPAYPQNVQIPPPTVSVPSVQAPPSVPVPVVAPPNLDKEIMEELKELDVIPAVPTPPAVPAPSAAPPAAVPPAVPATIIEEEEGRIEESE
jgi:hypothetical protein